MFLRTQLATALALIFFCFSSYAAQVSVKINDRDFSAFPPQDLTYQGKRIDASEALTLKKSGVDLSDLDPRRSSLWKGVSLGPNNQEQLDYPFENSRVQFKDFKSSPSEFFRAVVTKGKRQFVLTASLDNHYNILRATLLRLLGYDVDTPKYFKSLIVEFDSEARKKKFIELAGEETLTNRDRWVKKDIDKTTLEVVGFTLEPAELRNVNIYLPVMSRSRQSERRIFRALLNIYVLTDFPQSVNSISWQTGREFNNFLIFNHPYASAFSSVMIEDMRWIQKRLSKLERGEFEKAMEATGLPPSIQALLLEKLLSRANHLTKLLRSQGPLFSVQKNVSRGEVDNGKLVEDAFNDDYVVDFYKEDQNSPYRWSELFRLFKTQITYASVSSLLDAAMERFVPGLRVEDAMADIQQNIQDYQTQNPQQQGVMPLKAFTSPLVNGRGFANRNVVFGQYLGSNAPIQLVDSVGAEVSLGAFSRMTGAAGNIVPSASANVSLGRTYTHVRPMPDLKTATSEEIKKIFVPAHFKSLGKVIRDEYSCGIPEGPFVEEASIAGEKIYYIKYDPSWVRGKERAIDKRKELIDSGASETILLFIIHREELCEEEISTTRKKHLQEFLSQFALNEMFIVTDTVRLGANINAPIPLASTGLNLNLGADASAGLLRTVMVRKTAEGIEVTIQTQKNLKRSLSEGLSFFLEIINNNTAWTTGNLQSDVFKINLQNLNEAETDKALRALRSLFTDNDRDLVQDGYDPVEMNHDVLAKLNTFRLLFFKAENLKMEHEVEIVIPNRPGAAYTREQRTRSLFSVSNMRRKGTDFYSFIDRTLNSVTGFLGLGNGNSDPGKTFLGTSSKTYVFTEAELTTSRDFNPVTRVEFIWSGWDKRPKKLRKIFAKVEDLFKGVAEAPVLNDSVLTGFDSLKAYDVKTTIILYPKALGKIKKILTELDELAALNYLRFVYGTAKWDEYCDRAKDFFGPRGPHLYHLPKNRAVCAPPSAAKLMKIRSNELPTDRRELAKLHNEISAALFKNFEVSRTLSLLGKENFFSSTRVTGYREGHPDGMLEYSSNTVGTLNRDLATGLFDSLAGVLNISPYELRAMTYTPGML